MCISLRLDSAGEQTVVPNPTHVQAACAMEPQLLPNALSVITIFSVWVLAEKTSTENPQRATDITDDENIGERNSLGVRVNDHCEACAETHDLVLDLGYVLEHGHTAEGGVHQCILLLGHPDTSLCVLNVKDQRYLRAVDPRETQAPARVTQVDAEVGWVHCRYSMVLHLPRAAG